MELENLVYDLVNIDLMPVAAFMVLWNMGYVRARGTARDWKQKRFLRLDEKNGDGMSRTRCLPQAREC